MDKAKLLIIDDEVEFASTLCERLRLRGIDSTDVHSGTEGLKKLVEIAPNIVILDLKMPDINGIDVLARIKKHDPDIEVIMLTGHGSRAAGILAMEKGAIDYIMKPTDINELLEKINFAFAKHNKA
ncbi:response regulator [Desulfopila sp. IMCC35006]|uniref:response regulator n=1 Tax=Desulfopila sp. IMCC35006 TaxID=2569542 RepID=UPI0010AD31D3|nr:response regulator [Desulfopila sp. IMCC35006]TKB24398.1 response regulator [Desulfopila sp. IMCC35006]